MISSFKLTIGRQRESSSLVYIPLLCAGRNLTVMDQKRGGAKDSDWPVSGRQDQSTTDLR